MVTLVILDGFGIGKKDYTDAIYCAGTPHLDKLKKNYPCTELDASGTSVGLPAGQMGNSEVGHLTLGSGRVTLQELENINNEIKNGNFFKNKALLKAIKHAETNKSCLHLMGLLSNGGVHSHIEHLIAILAACKNRKIKHIYIHPFMDGRDTGEREGLNFVRQIEDYIAKNNLNASFADVGGRVYGMDREKRWDRVKKAYKVMFNAAKNDFKSAEEALQASYAGGVTDEFVVPVVIDKNGNIKENDSVIFFNFRADRARELSQAITDPNFKEFKTKKFKNLLFSPMQEYDENMKNFNVFYPNIVIKDNLAAILSENGLKQFHIAETTKYAHVTFFFNGGIEKPYKGEDRKLVDSINVQNFSSVPKMRAYEITESVLDAIASAKYDFIVVNYSNPDMVGHTGNFNATKEAITHVEKCAYAVALATLMAGGDCIITADHGNAELMIDEKTGNAITSHTTNKVPFILVSDKHKKAKLKKGCSIANVAPTILELLNLQVPNTMKEPLFKK